MSILGSPPGGERPGASRWSAMSPPPTPSLALPAQRRKSHTAYLSCVTSSVTVPGLACATVAVGLGSGHLQSPAIPSPTWNVPFEGLCSLSCRRFLEDHRVAV